MRLDLPIIFLTENGTKLCAPAALLISKTTKESQRKRSLMTGKTPRIQVKANAGEHVKLKCCHCGYRQTEYLVHTAVF